MGNVPKNVGAQLLVKRCISEHEPGDDSWQDGAGVNRQDALSALLIVSGVFTAGSSGTSKLHIRVQESDEDGSWNDDLVEAFDHDIAIASGGDAHFCYTLPIDLSGAKKWIRPGVKIAIGDATAGSDYALTANIVLGGLVEKPHSDYDLDSDKGYSDHDLSGVA